MTRAPSLPLIYREYEPSRYLAPFVRAYFTFGSEEQRANGFVLQRTHCFASAALVSPLMMADVATSIVIKSGDEWWVAGVEEGGSKAGATLFGPMPRGHATRIGPGISAAGVYFRVGALCNFLALPMDELLGRALPVGELFDPAEQAAIAATLASPDPTARLRVLEAVLTRRLNQRSPLTNTLAHRFYQQCLRGQTSVDAIALELGVSRQYLARHLRLTVGAPPKLVARIARFQNVLKAMRVRATSWAAIAADLGYCDQSHLIADFRDFAATSPAAWARAGQFHPHCL